MEHLRTILTILFVIVAIALTLLIMVQESKSGGLTGIVGGTSDNTYWSKNKGRSAESKRVKYTKILGLLFFVLALVINMNW